MNKPCYFRDGQILYIDSDYGEGEFFGVYVDKRLWLYVIESDYFSPKSIVAPESSPYDLNEYNLRSEGGYFTNQELDEACKAFESELGINLELIAGLGKDEHGNFCYTPKKTPNITNKHKRNYVAPRVILHYKDGSSYKLKNCTTISVNPSVKYKYFIVIDFSKIWRYSFTEDEVEAITVIRKGRKKFISGDEDYSLILETPKRW